jgi:hypothetical protein
MSLCPRELRDRYQDGRVLPFIGAGASMSVSWKNENGEEVRGPSWGEMVNQAASLLGFADVELARVRGTDQQILEYFRIKHGNQIAKLTNWLSKLMDPPDDVLIDSPLHDELSKLDKSRLLYTTNYDNFVERAFRLKNIDTHVSAIEMQLGLGNYEREVIKFHGDLDHPGQIVLTESDYEQRLRFSTPMDFRLRSDLLGRVILFIGYSFRDPNVSYLFRLFCDEFYEKGEGLRGTRAYIVVPDPSEFERALFAQRRIEVIGIDGRNKTEETVKILAEMRV